MSPDQLVRAWFREVWNEGREDAIDRLMAPDGVANGIGEEPIVGPAQFKKHFHIFRNALGNMQIEVVRTVVDGDMVVAHCHVTARHSGPAFGGPPTGLPVDFWGMTIARVRDGKLIEGWNCFDFLTMYQQLGWVQNPVVPAGVE